MRWFRKKKKYDDPYSRDDKPTMPKGHKYKRPEEPKISKNKTQHIIPTKRNSSDRFMVIRSYNGSIVYPVYELVIVEKNLEIKKYDGRCKFTLLTSGDTKVWKSRCTDGLFPVLTWNNMKNVGRSCHDITSENLYTILHNFFQSDFVAFDKCQHSGAFTNEELGKIFPYYGNVLKNAKIKAELEFLEEQSKIDDEEIEKHRRIKKILDSVKEVAESNGRLSYLGNIFVEEFVDTEFPTEYAMLLDLDTDVPTHIAIIGGSGSGKSITAFDIAEDTLHERIPVLVLDPTGQWSGFLRKCDDERMMSLYQNFKMPKFNFEFKGFRGRIYTPGSDIGLSLQSNLLAKPHRNRDRELSAHADAIMNIVSEFCKIQGNDSYKVRKRIYDEWNSGNSLDYKSLQDMFKKEANIANKIHKLQSLDFLFEGKGSFDFSNIIYNRGINIVSLTDLKSEDVEMFVSYFVLRELVDYFDSQQDSPKLRLLLVIEEAHRFKGEAVKLLERVVRTLRKKGVGCVFVSQKMTDLSPAIRANIATRIWMRTKYLEDIERAKEDLGEFSSKLSGLKTGTGILSSTRFNEPFFVKFRPCIVRTRGLSSIEISEKMKNVDKKCKVCENQISASAKFCSNCGTKV